MPVLLYSLLASVFATAQSTRLVFSPHWFPQAQFAGFYVALDQGFYKKVGLDVTILHPSSSVTCVDYLLNGKADIISTFLLDALKLRAKGLPIVHAGQFSQHSALMVVARKSSGIRSMKDLNGKKLGIWSYGFDDVPKAYFRQHRYDVKLIPLHNTINLFLMGGIDAMTCMYYNEYDQIINSGVNENELNTFFFSDYGYDIPEDCLIGFKTTYNTKKNAIIAFKKATFKGWDYAARHKEYTVGLVVKEMEKAHLPNNKAHQRWMLDRWLGLIEPGNKRNVKGCLSLSDFEKAISILRSGEKTDYPDTDFGATDFSNALDN